MKYNKLFILALSLVFLTACNTYKVDVDLTPEEVSKIEADITGYKTEIANHDDSDGRIAWEAIINMANAYVDLGELGKAIKLYEGVLSEGPGTQAIVNNLGRLYETVERYDDAIVQYQILIDDYFEHEYLRDITWAYIRAGNRQEAEKYFNEWQLYFSTTDGSIQQAIKKMRADEQNVE